MRPLTSLSLIPLLCGAFLLGCSSPRTSVRGSSSSASISYHLSLPDPASETFAVSATLENIVEDTTTFYFPIWAPGAYDIVNFGAYVSDFTARGSNGQPLRVVRVDTSTFKIIGASRRIDIGYRVHDIEAVPNSMWFCISDIENDYAFANGTAIFGYPAGYKEIPYTVSYNAPPGWSVAVALDSADSSGTFRARDYDELVDAPVQMGKFQRFDFNVGGREHTITLTMIGSKDTIDGRRIVAITDTVVRLVSGFFGEMPYDRYLFEHYLEDPRRSHLRSLNGALEHRNSSTYLMPYFQGISLEGSLAPVIAHEYWHLWSPKRIHVKQLGPFDYQSIPRTSSLWFAEGLTEYYARILLLRGGLTKTNAFLRETEGDIRPLYQHRQHKPITELSLDISEDPPMESIALYSTGPMIGLLLDAAIRTQTGNNRSLDDAMRYFNEEYGKKGRSFDDEEIIPIMERATGAKLAEFYRRYIAGHEPLPFDEYLPKIGLRYAPEQETKKGLAAELESVKNGWLVVSVAPGGSADSMGLRSGDIITQVNQKEQPIGVAGNPVEFAEIFVTLPGFKGFTILRDGKEIALSGHIIASLVEVRRLKLDPDATGAALAIRKSMLGF
jgi:predicted metalloprotease with PDZ domain